MLHQMPNRPLQLLMRIALVVVEVEIFSRGRRRFDRNCEAAGAGVGAGGYINLAIARVGSNQKTGVELQRRRKEFEGRHSWTIIYGRRK